jgi:dynein heavy chain
VIKNDFAGELNQFLAAFYEVQYKEMTYLFIPKDGVDKTVEELVKDKVLVTRFEGKTVELFTDYEYDESIRSAVILKWHHQLKNILLIQDRLMNIEDQSTGIHEEIDFWQNCLTNLHNIHKQLKRTELQNIIRVLNLSKSAYIQQFLQAEKEVQVKESFFECNRICFHHL